MRINNLQILPIFHSYDINDIIYDDTIIINKEIRIYNNNIYMFYSNDKENRTYYESCKDIDFTNARVYTDKYIPADNVNGVPQIVFGKWKYICDMPGKLVEEIETDYDYKYCVKAHELDYSNHPSSNHIARSDNPNICIEGHSDKYVLPNCEEIYLYIRTHSEIHIDYARVKKLLMYFKITHDIKYWNKFPNLEYLKIFLMGGCPVEHPIIFASNTLKTLIIDTAHFLKPKDEITIVDAPNLRELHLSKYTWRRCLIYCVHPDCHIYVK